MTATSKGAGSTPCVLRYIPVQQGSVAGANTTATSDAKRKGGTSTATTSMCTYSRRHLNLCRTIQYRYHTAPYRYATQSCAHAM